jgi:hypothetical protein
MIPITIPRRENQMEISLSTGPWFLKGYWPWVPLKDKSMETGKKVNWNNELDSSNGSWGSPL